MSTLLSLTITFLDNLFCGQGDDGPEWPPSPHRLFQAMLCAAARNGCDSEEEFQWFEGLAPPDIFTPDTSATQAVEFFVPNNDADVSKKFERQNRLTSKVIRSTRILGDSPTVRYLWTIHEKDKAMAERIIHHARLISAVGWGIDLVVANAQIVNDETSVRLEGSQRWTPALYGKTLRCPAKGSLRDLRNVYDSFLNCIDGKYYQAPRRPSIFRKVAYRSCKDTALTRPHITFELRQDDGKYFQYPQRKLIHIAGMVRHLAIDAMKKSPPPDVPDVAEWVDRYVAGHARDYQGEHRQFSYLPLPSIGNPHADQAVRRVMIAAPVGEEQLLKHLARHLDGKQLEAKRGDEFGFDENGKPNPPPTLLRSPRDKVAACYTRPANTWATVTPVILPGHTDRKRRKTIKLIERSLKEAGIEQPCTFEWSPCSRFPKSLSAHKTDREGRPIYFKPPYLQNLTALHLTLVFDNELDVPGPIALGAGRHCGLGLMAAYE